MINYCKVLTYAIIVTFLILAPYQIAFSTHVKRMSTEQGVKNLPILNKFGGTAQLASNESVSLDEAFNSGYNSGYKEGEHNATNAVYSSGYEHGVSNAMNDVYRSGYEHGVNDGKRGDITEDTDKHPAKYDQGWVDGYCSVAGKGAGSDSDKGTFECSLDATQYKW